MKNTQLVQVAKLMRLRAEPVGPMHGLWESIIDLEELAQGRKTLLTRDQIEEQATDFLLSLTHPQNIWDCNICGGRVDMTDHKKPTVTFGRGPGKQ